MASALPSDRAAKRRALLERVDSVRETLRQGADLAEEQATLPAATVAALYDTGLLALKLPAELGGAEADPVTQMDVIEAVAAIDASAAWCLMVGATTLALPAVFLPDDSVAALFARGRAPRAAGVIAPGGQAVPVPGGYRVTGRWPFASGVRHAEWVGATALVAGGRAGASARRYVVFDAGAATVHANWQVAGLAGTGSCDVSVADLFVPEAFTWDLATAEPRRGGPVYRLGLPAFVANEHAAFAIGVARRALDAIAEQAADKPRETSRPTPMAARAAFHRDLGEAEIALRAARVLAADVFERAWQVVAAGGRLDVRAQAECRACATWATRIGLEVVTAAFRHAGGNALYRANPLQRCLRDLQAAAQHFVVADSAYDGLGQAVLGLPDVNPMM